MSEQFDPRYIVPKDVSAPIPFFIWGMIETVITIVLIGAGLIMGSLMLGLCLGVGLLFVSSKMQDPTAKRGTANHFMYRIGLVQDKGMKIFPYTARCEFHE